MGSTPQNYCNLVSKPDHDLPPPLKNKRVLASIAADNSNHYLEGNTTTYSEVVPKQLHN